MKKLNKFGIVAGVCGLAIASTANAYCGKTKFYVGATADYNLYKLSPEIRNYVATNVHGKNKINGLGFNAPIIGVKFNRHIGAEAGYSFNRRYKIVSNTPNSIFRVRNMYVDMLGSMPLFRSMDLIAGVGIGKLSAIQIEDLNGVNDIRNKFGIRAKAGVNYRYLPKIGIRGMVTYQGVRNVIKSTGAAALNDTKLIKHMVSLSVGLTYSF